MATGRCRCCGEPTRGGEFLPGHDAKLKSRLVRALRSGDTSVVEELVERGWHPSQQIRFGVEIECLRPDDGRDNWDFAEQLRWNGHDVEVGNRSSLFGADWKLTRDSSISGDGIGIELVSKPLKGEAGLRKMRKMAATLEALGCKVNRTCGFHVHIDAGPQDAASMLETIKVYSRNQSTVNQLVSPSRRNGNTYCKTLTYRQTDRLEIQVRIHGLRAAARLADRYTVVNLNAYAKHGTLEFRQHQGTLDGEKASAWVRLVQAMVWAGMEASRSYYPQHQHPFGSVETLVDRLLLTPQTQNYLIARAVALA